MIVLRTPKGWTGPKESWTACRSKARSARTRFRWTISRAKPEHIQQLEAWMKSYRPEELFDETGRPVAEID